jgi:Ca-activated chloride channel homolog
MPSFEYARWDGTQHFAPLSAEQAFDQLVEHLLEHGEALLRYLERHHDDDSDLLKLLVKEGYLEKDEEGRLGVSSRGVRRIEEKAMLDLFTITRKDAAGKHDTPFKGAGTVLHEDSKPYVYGDPVANLNLHETLKNAVVRQRGGLPVRVTEDDFVVHQTEYQTSCATVILLDMSGSMARFGKFSQAKKVALGLQALVRGRYQEDSLDIVGFYTYASPLSERSLALAAPKPVSLFDSRVFLRVSLDRPPAFVPEHFTNIQAGLRFARDILRRQSAQNKQIICVTDGEPTAHIEGRDLVLIYPPSEKTATHTLEEVARCTREGIRLSTFALIEDYFYLGLVNFVDRMARLSRGVAAYCTAGELGKYVLDSFVSGHRARKHVG